MKGLLILLAPALAGCALQGPPAGPAVEPEGRPRLGISPSVIERAPPPLAAASQALPRLPAVITLPATYRLVFLDGHAALVRETNESLARAGSDTARLVASESPSGDPTLQPAPLTQELEREIAASRESSARMDNALASVMARSRELAELALRLESEERRFAELMAADELRARDHASARPPSSQPTQGAPAADQER